MARKESFVWTTYSDLISSLFFIMLLLFVVVFIRLYNVSKGEGDLLAQVEKLQNSLREKDNEIIDIKGKLVATQKQLETIKEIEESEIKSQYFKYSPEHKKYILTGIDVQFDIEKSNIENLDFETRSKLESAGKDLNGFVRENVKKHSEIKYLLIIEGQASKDGIRSRQSGNTELNYDLSYQRALSLKKFWEKEGIDFGENCEVVISGSGNGVLSGTGFMREDYEKNNQRFLIHILPKTTIPKEMK
ncbi:hypothetical protein J5690_07165 [bacterium]|nr:hypothetical protein [bacterium]